MRVVAVTQRPGPAELPDRAAARCRHRAACCWTAISARWRAASAPSRAASRSRDEDERAGPPRAARGRRGLMRRRHACSAGACGTRSPRPAIAPASSRCCWPPASRPGPASACWRAAPAAARRCCAWPRGCRGVARRRASSAIRRWPRWRAPTSPPTGSPASRCSPAIWPRRARRACSTTPSPTRPGTMRPARASPDARRGSGAAGRAGAVRAVGGARWRRRCATAAR